MKMKALIAVGGCVLFAACGGDDSFNPMGSSAKGETGDSDVVLSCAGVGYVTGGSFWFLFTRSKSGDRCWREDINLIDSTGTTFMTPRRDSECQCGSSHDHVCEWEEGGSRYLLLRDRNDNTGVCTLMKIKDGNLDPTWPKHHSCDCPS